jgi:hypothetical protein
MLAELRSAYKTLIPKPSLATVSLAAKRRASPTSLAVARNQVLDAVAIANMNNSINRQLLSAGYNQSALDRMLTNNSYIDTELSS